MDQHARTQPATLTVTAGQGGLRLGVRTIAQNWPLMLVLVGTSTAYGLRNGDGDTSSTLVRTGVVLVAAFAVSIAYYVIYGLSSITLTRDELVVSRAGFRQRLPRDQVAEIVRGTVDRGNGLGADSATMTFIVNTEGERFVGLPTLQWHKSALEELADALDVRIRTVKDREEEERLTPGWIKHIFAMTGGVVMIMIVGFLVWWAVFTWQEARLTNAEETAQQEFVTSVEPELTTTRFPHVDEGIDDRPVELLSVSAHAEQASEVDLRSSIRLRGTDAELPASEVLDLLDLQCAASPPGAEVSLAAVSYESNEDFGYDRVAEHECGADRTELEQWLAWAGENPAGAELGARDVSQGLGYDGETIPLEVNIQTPDTEDATFDAAVEYVCAYPETEDLTIHIRDEDLIRSLHHVRCETL